MTDSSQTCPLCREAGGEVLYHGRNWRLIVADEPEWPGFLRVVWNHHVREMSELASRDRHELIDTLCAVETLMRTHLLPDKINLASLGNQVAHLHWHLIPRFADDSHFPAPIWSQAVRTGLGPDAMAELTGPRMCALRTAIADHFGPR